MIAAMILLAQTLEGCAEERLALMQMADVHCRCGKPVGYAFCGDKTPDRRNLHQVGRFGLVASRFRVAPYKLAGAISTD